MSDSITIALDAMGGDRAPAMVLKGADIALERHPGAQFLLFGDAAQITPLLAALPRLAAAATVHHTDEAVADGETGLVVRRPTDVGTVARSIGRLLGDRALRDAMGTASRRRAEASFDYDKLAPRLAASLADVAG